MAMMGRWEGGSLRAAMRSSRDLQSGEGAVRDFMNASFPSSPAQIPMPSTKEAQTGLPELNVSVIQEICRRMYSPKKTD